MKTLWFVGGGGEAAPAIALARSLGHRVVVSDRNPEAPGMALADHRAVASTYDPEETLAAVRDFERRVGRIDGVLSVAHDVPVTVARVAEALGLPGIPVETARLATHKLEMKRRLARDGIPVPWFAPARHPEEVETALREIGPPLVVKPVDSRGARGVVRITGNVDPKWAFEVARAESPSGAVLLEQYLEGPQISTESVLVDGRAATPGFADRNYGRLEQFAPFVIEDGGDLPTTLPERLRRRVREVVEAAALSLGIRTGIAKGDVVVHRGEPTVIELAARPSGGYFCTHEIPLSTGVEPARAAIALALGEPLDPRAFEPRFERPVCQRYLFPEPGRVVAVAGVESVLRAPGIAYLEVRVRPGDRIAPVRSHPARAGVVIATGSSRAEARSRAEAAVEAIEIATEP